MQYIFHFFLGLDLIGRCSWQCPMLSKITFQKAHSIFQFIETGLSSQVQINIIILFFLKISLQQYFLFFKSWHFWQVQISISLKTGTYFPIYRDWTFLAAEIDNVLYSTSALKLYTCILRLLFFSFHIILIILRKIASQQLPMD
jgi:hypothetical protein